MDLETGLFIAQNLDRIKKERIQKLQEVIDQMEMEEYKEPKMYKLDVSTIETIEDVKIILDGLDLTISEDSEKYESVKKYFKEMQ
jgi:hypothetical protein